MGLFCIFTQLNYGDCHAIVTTSSFLRNFLSLALDKRIAPRLREKHRPSLRVTPIEETWDHMIRRYPILASALVGAALIAGLSPTAHAEIGFRRLDAFTGAAGNGEILSYSSLENTVASTIGGMGVELLNLSTAGQLSSRGDVKEEAQAATPQGPEYPCATQRELCVVVVKEL
ncbi:MAG: hypothetical protein ACI915_004466 [Gammaproteobacteria bacterium]